MAVTHVLSSLGCFLIASLVVFELLSAPLYSKCVSMSSLKPRFKVRKFDELGFA